MRTNLIILVLIISCSKNFGQGKLIALNDSEFVVKGICKNVYDVFMIKNDKSHNVVSNKIPLQKNSVVETIAARPHFITLHGNLQYNWNYQSYLDTPYLQKDLIHQSVQTRLSFLIKDQYPFAVFITHRNSNSPYFINATDVNFQFKQSTMLDVEKKKLRKELEEALVNKNLKYTPKQLYQLEQEGVLKINDKNLSKVGLQKISDLKNDSLKNKFEALYADYKNQKDKINKLDKWLNKTNHSQEIIEEKEKQLREEILSKNKPADTSLNDSLKNKITDKLTTLKHLADSAKTKVEQNIEFKKQELEKYEKELAKIETKLKVFQKKTRDSVTNLMVKLNAVKDLNSLQDYLNLTKKDSNMLSTFKRLLLSIKQVGVGRTWLDYSELTVKNVSLNGLNIEMNPNKLYLAAAIGKVNYRFRDFIVKDNAAGSSQSLALVRFGYGQKEKENLIFTYYTGQKALLNKKE